MNRELFISDFKQLSRLYPAELLPEKVADYVEGLTENRLHNPYENMVDKDIVIGLCCEHFNISLKELVDRSRKRRVVYPRFVLMHLLLKRTRMTQGDIARLFERDHTSVIHAIHSIEDLVDTDMAIRYEIEDLNNKL